MSDPLIHREDKPLSKAELERYSRHLIMPEFGVAAQKHLQNARVLIIGTGGLGSPTTRYLAAAGVGKIGIVDFDVVDETNLQRQVIHATPDVGRPKIDSAIEKLKALNPHIELEAHETRFESTNARELVEPYDLVIDGTDNFPTRYLTNDVCVLLGKPNVYGSIFRFEGQASVFWAEQGPCYRCLYPEPPPPGLVPSCAEGGVLGILPGIIGVIQATEAIKVLTGIGDSLVGRLLLFDALGMKFRELKLRKDPNCPLCGDQPTITDLIDYQQFCGVPQAEAPTETPQADTAEVIDCPTLAGRLRAEPDLQLLDVRELHEAQISRLDGSTLIPLGEIPNRLNELDPAQEVVVYCRSGQRSAQAQAFMKANGFSRVTNLTGGILAWADSVDPTMPKY